MRSSLPTDALFLDAPLFTATALGALALTGTILAQAQPSTEPSATDKVRITGWALNMSSMATGANQTIQIDIDAWPNPSQRQSLIQTFLEKKQDGLLRELEKQSELGKFRFPGYTGPDPNNVMRLGTAIRYAMSFPMENGGRRIVVITRRVIGFREARNQPRTVDCPFSLFEMRFDKDKNSIEIENCSSEPVRLNQLKLEQKK